MSFASVGVPGLPTAPAFGSGEEEVRGDETAPEETDWDGILARLAETHDRLMIATGAAAAAEGDDASAPAPAPAPAPRAPASPLALRGDPRGGWTPSPPRARSREGSPGEEDVALARAAPPPASPSGGGLPTLRARVPAPGEHHEHEHPRRLAELASEVPMLMMISLEPGRSPADLRADREAVAACLDDFYAELHRRLASVERARAGAGAVIARSAPDGGGGSPAAAARELRGAARDLFRGGGGEGEGEGGGRGLGSSVDSPPSEPSTRLGGAAEGAAGEERRARIGELEMFLKTLR